jgi:hypothetical protein
MISLKLAILNRDRLQSFTVYRSSGDWDDNGRWTENAPTQIVMKGVVSVANQKELNQYPEGDRIKGAMVFHTIDPLYPTRTGTDKGTSDKIMWDGEYYRLANVWPYKDYGYYKAIGFRIKGS